MARLATIAILLALSVPALSAPVLASDEHDGQITTFRCRFVNGPRAGQIEDYSRYKDVAPILIGAPCQDAGGSWGIGISNDSDDLPPNRPVADARGRPILPTGVTLSCKFNDGPRAGAVQRFGFPIMPFRVGSDCSDGAGNSGVAQEE